MNKIKCVAFDVGNVASWGGEDRLRKAQERWGESFCASDFKRMLAPDLGDGVDYWRRFQNGLMSPDEYLSAAVRAVGFPDTKGEREHFADRLRVMAGGPYDPTIKLASRLRKQHGIIIGLLTNNNVIMYDLLLSTDLMDCADVVAVLGVAFKRLPVRECIGDRRAHGALRQHLRPLGLRRPACQHLVAVCGSGVVGFRNRPCRTAGSA